MKCTNTDKWFASSHTKSNHGFVLCHLWGGKILGQTQLPCHKSKDKITELLNDNSSDKILWMNIIIYIELIGILSTYGYLEVISNLISWKAVF